MMVWLLQRVTRHKPAIDAHHTTKTELISQRSSLTNHNELNNQHSNITNEKAALHSEIQRADSTGLCLLYVYIYVVYIIVVQLIFPVHWWLDHFGAAHVAEPHVDSEALK